MATCPELPSNWLCNFDPLPHLSVRIILLTFDILAIITIITAYKYSRIASVKTKLNFIQRKDIHISQKVYSGILISFIGLFMIAINNLISHLSIILVPEYQAYLFIGFESYISGIGFALLLVGLYLFTKFFDNEISSNIDVSPMQVMKGYIILSIILLFAPVTVYSLSKNLTYEIYQFVPTFQIIAFVIFGYMFSKFQFSNKIIKVRSQLIGLIYSVLFVLLSIAFIFVPEPDSDPSTHLTKNNEIEFLLFVINVGIVIIALIFYLIVKIPLWLREIYDIDQLEFEEYMFGRFGVENPNIISINMEYLENRGLKNNISEKLHQGFLLFENLDDDEINRKLLIEIINDKFPVLDTFSTNNVREQYFVNTISTKSNLIFVSNELDENFNSLLDGIYDIYNWEIEMDNNSVYFNDFLYRLPNVEFGFIFSGSSVWNQNYKLYLIGCSNKLNSAMYHFINNYANFLEELSLTQSFFMVLFFDLDKNENYVPIPPDENDPEIPNESNYRIFRHKS